MNQKQPSKPSIPAKHTSATRESAGSSADFAFGKINYKLMITSILLIIIGYMLMAGGKPTDPAVFNDAVFSFRRITVAPIVVIAGYVLGVYAIIKRAD